MDTTKNMPGLIRMVVVDNNILPGRIDEVPLDDHAVVLAENGSGKTSLIQLIPIFYGEKMSAVVNSRERDTFIGHYLPRQSSYLAFEYRNARGEVRSVVIHSDGSRERLQYRFVRGGLCEEMFLMRDGDQVEFIASTGFEQRLRALGIDHASRLVTSTRSYRGIIQGWTDPTVDTRDRAYHNSLIADYGHTDRRNPMVGVEKILTQMLRNSVSMKSLLGVVARQATESGQGTFRILGDSKRQDIADWPRRHQGYRKVMDAEPIARRASTAKSIADEARTEMYGRLAALAAYEADKSTQIADLTKEIDALKAQEETAGSTYRAQITASEDALSRLRSEHKALTDEIARMEKRDSVLRSRGGAEARAKVDLLPRLMGEADAAQATREALGAKGDAVARKFDAAFTTSKDGAAESLARLAQDTQTGLSAADQTFESFDEAKRSALAELRNTLDVDLDKIDSQTQIARADRDKHLQDMAAVGPDPRIAEEHKALKARRDQILAEHDKQGNIQRTAENRLRDATHKLEISSRELSGAEKDFQAAIKNHEQVVQEVTPEAGTLLAEVKANRPGWAETIGKVIRPDLLQMKTLSPAFDEEGDSLYGLHLDLDRLDVPAHADEQSAEDRLQRASNIADEAKKSLDLLAKAHDRQGRERSQAEKALSEANAVLDSLQRKLVAAEEDLGVKSDEVERSLTERRADLKNAVAKIEASLADLEAQKGVAKNEASERIKSFEGEITTARATRDTERKRLRDTEQMQRKEIEEHLKAELSKLEAQRGEALKSEGVNAEALAEADAKIASIQAQISEAKASRELADTWAAHVESMKGMAERKGRHEQMSFDLRTQETALTSLKAARDAALKEIEAKRNKVRDAKQAAEDVLAEIIRELDAVGGERREPQREQFYAEGVEANLTQMRRRRAALTEAEVEGRKLAKQISNIFYGCGDAGISAYFLEQDLGAPSLDWVPAILRWYDHDHSETLEMLMGGLVAIIQPIRASYQQLRQADEGIRRTNRKLTKSISSNPGFPHVRDVELSLVSRIREQEFWKDMESLEEAFTQWQHTDGRQPSEALVAALVAFLDHWKDDEDPVLQIEDMIYLKGQMVERGHLRKFGRNTDLSDLSSNGNIIILRLILFTALLSVMRKGQAMRLVWSVDEIGALDVENTKSLLDMLSANDITLLTAAPNLDRRVKHAFEFQMRIQDRQLYRLGVAHTGIRAWIADDQLDYPGNHDSSETDMGEGDLT
ncbi:ATP-binding protein [Sulfitobacter sp. 1A13353]|uniref:ATP-binding protein n=1 Tax=Sulfitobacter sp. 1A13353 TaxID=3368568 RepID=UPI0037462E0A